MTADDWKISRHIECDGTVRMRVPTTRLTFAEARTIARGFLEFLDAQDPPALPATPPAGRTTTGDALVLRDCRGGSACATTEARVLYSRRPLRAIAESLCETIEREVRLREDKAQHPGGQHVPNHGDFAGLPPSAMMRLSRWARDLREALAAEPVE